MLHQRRSLFSYFKIRLSVLLASTTLLLSSCGGKSISGNSAPVSSQAVAISVQPLSQTVPIGETATFTVTATGTAPLAYQWSENGTEISGATSASYTTPPVALSSNGSTSIGSFQVAVSNSVSSVSSSTATLTAGPRSPKAGDLRYLLFQQVDLPGLLNGSGLGGVQVNLGGNIVDEWADNAVGSPLGIGSSYACDADGCYWPFFYQFLPSPMTGLDMYYQGGDYSSFTSDLQSYAASNVVFTSLDLEPAGYAYAVSWVKTAQTGGFDYRLEVVPQTEIQATAAADGAASRVITAASFDASGNANLISYGWTGDTTTVYDAQTIVVPSGDVGSTATELAGEGYIISAFGGNDTTGYMLIGMRVHGDSLPRPIIVSTRGGTVPVINSNPPYFTTVVYLNEPSGDFTIVSEQ